MYTALQNILIKCHPEDILLKLKLIWVEVGMIKHLQPIWSEMNKNTRKTTGRSAENKAPCPILTTRNTDKALFHKEMFLTKHLKIVWLIYYHLQGVAHYTTYSHFSMNGTLSS